MDTSRYQAFLSAAETGSIKNAAEELGYTPSGVSQLIKALEEELGFTLLYRSKKGVSLTLEGRRLRPTIREILESENRLFQTASEMRGLSIGAINIAAYQCLAAVWMPSLISGFQKKYPNIRIQLYEGTQQDILQYLDERTVNLAFFNCSGKNPEPPSPLRHPEMQPAPSQKASHYRFCSALIPSPSIRYPHFPLPVACQI